LNEGVILCLVRNTKGPNPKPRFCQKPRPIIPPRNWKRNLPGIYPGLKLMVKKEIKFQWVPMEGTTLV